MPDQDREDQKGRTRSGLDPNERLPTGALRPQARAHPEDFTRNTGAGGALSDGGERELTPAPQTQVIPSDSPGG